MDANLTVNQLDSFAENPNRKATLNLNQKLKPSKNRKIHLHHLNQNQIRRYVLHRIMQ